MLRETNRAKTNKCCVMPLRRGTRRGQIHGDRKSDGGCPGLGWEWGLVFNGDRVLVWEDEQVPEMDGGVTQQWEDTELCTYAWVRRQNLLRVFYYR